jgi:uncharacterized protein (AIM24 family)
MSRYSLKEFVQQTAQQELNQGTFELESDRMLEVNLDGLVWMKMGAMVSYRGQIKFTREGVLEQGFGNLLKKAVSGEGARLTRGEGRGKMYLADRGKKISIIRLEGEAICVNGQDILAFEPTIRNEIRLIRRVAGMIAGGFFNYHLSGSGLIAITSHYNPMTLRVLPGYPVFTDPNATIAWSANLVPDLKADLSFRTFLGRGSGESFQMKFEGDGFVVVQPYEEVHLATGA